MWARRAGSWLLAVVLTYVLATVAATRHVAASLDSMGAEVGLGTLVGMVGHDLVGMATSFLPMVAIGFLIAFVVAGLLVRWLRGWQYLLYPLAGAAAIFAIHVALKASFDITPVAAARSTGGLVIQSLAGAVGGYLFVRLRPSLR